MHDDNNLLTPLILADNKPLDGIKLYTRPGGEKVIQPLSANAPDGSTTDTPPSVMAG